MLGPVGRRGPLEGSETSGVVRVRQSRGDRVLREIPAGSLPGPKRSRLGIITRRYDFFKI